MTNITDTRINPQTGFFWEAMVYSEALKKTIMVPRCQRCGHNPSTWCVDGCKD